ncbi:MAG TPA: hypothetical protein VMR08_00375 [Patescibacteria group bacterium]|nr:hypothetical protein [Patescibacteria group bacterium]
MTISKINRKLVITSFAVLILVAVVGTGVYLWQHGKVNNLNQQLKAQKSMYTILQSGNSNLQQEYKNLSGKLNNSSQSLSNATKIYHVSDSQDGITLVGVYPYSYQNMMEGNGPTPPTVHLLYFAVSGTNDLVGHTAVLTTDGLYLTTDGPLPTIPACGKNACVSYLDESSEGHTASIFYFKDLQWQL